MSRIISVPISIKPSMGSSDGFVSDASGDKWPITNEEIPGGCGHFVKVTNKSSKDYSKSSVTLTGFGPNGEPVSDVIALPKAGKSVESTKAFSKLVLAQPSKTTGSDSFDIGWSNRCYTRWYSILGYPSFVHLLIESGVMSYKMQYAYNNSAILNNAICCEVEGEFEVSKEFKFIDAMPVAVRAELLNTENAEFIFTVVFPSNVDKK